MDNARLISLENELVMEGYDCNGILSMSYISYVLFKI